MVNATNLLQCGRVERLSPERLAPFGTRRQLVEIHLPLRQESDYMDLVCRLFVPSELCPAHEISGMEL